MRKIVTAMACGMLLAASAGVSARAQTIPYSEPEAPCDVSFGHFLANSAHLYLQHASEGKYTDQVPKLMRDSYNALVNALAQGQASNPAIWLLLGRYYGMKGDLPGADSAYAKAQALEPKCTKDITDNRRSAWANLVNNGVQAQKRNDDSSARVSFLKANTILATDPTTYYYVANIAANQSQHYFLVADSLRHRDSAADSARADSVTKLANTAVDSALVYYRITIKRGADSANRTVASLQDMRMTSTFNVARLFHRRKEWDSAAAYYSKVRETHPNDAQALTGLATVYSLAGKTTAANALYDTVIVLADSMDPLDLFAAGVELFKIGAFDRSAMALKLGLKRDPNFRDALYNLANTYLSAGNDLQAQIDSILNAAAKAPAPPPRGARAGRGGARPGADTSAVPKLREQRRAVGDSMIPIARRLTQIDPCNKASMRLLAAAYQQISDDDSTLAVLGRWHNMPFDVDVTSFDQVATGARLSGVVTSPANAPATVPPLMFEFLDKDGKVVTTATVTTGQLPANTAKAFAASPTGAHIVAWRYKTGT